MRPKINIALAAAMIFSLLLNSTGIAYVGTDLPDYSPGSVVTIYGDNSDGAGYLPGETVNVDVSGPNSWAAQCQGVAGEAGDWSCQVTLDPTDLAVGSYSYTAAGVDSGVTQTGTFTDSKATITGTVKDASSNPIEGAAVACNAGCPDSTATIADGTYTLKPNFSGGSVSVTLKASKIGFLPQSLSFSIANGGTYTGKNFTLTPHTIAPVITVPAPITMDAAAGSGSVVTFTVTASDDYPASPAVTCVPASGSLFPIGVTTVNCSATDDAQNVATGSFTVTVEDKTPPSLNLPNDITRTASSPAGEVIHFNPSATDWNPNHPSVTCDPASGSTFPVGETTVNCSATDTAGNTGTGSFKVTVNYTPPSDLDPPVLSLPADFTAEATGPGGAVITYTATATDANPTNPTVTCNPASGATFPLGPTTVNCSATDAAGNTGTGSFTVTVQDTTNPGIIFISRTEPDQNGWNRGNVNVIWGCTDAVGVVNSVVTVTVETEGENQSATGTCEDTSGHTVSATINGINIDKTKPEMTASGDPKPNTNGWNNTDVEVTFGCTDGLSKVDETRSTLYGTLQSSGTLTGTCYDLAGNSTTATYTALIDKVAPTVNCSVPDVSSWYGANVDVTCTASDAGSDLADSGDASFVLSTTVADGEETDNAQTGSRTVYDKAGNASTAGPYTFKVDLKAPTVTATPDREPDHNGWYNHSLVITFSGEDGGSGMGDCDSPVTYSTPDSETASKSGTCKDMVGNVGTGRLDFKYDSTPPTITTEVSPERPASGWWNIVSGAPTVTFTCSDDTSKVVACPEAHPFVEGENQAFSATVYDNAGNSNSAGVTDIDVDLTAPTLTWVGGPADGGSYYFGFLPVKPTCTSADSLSEPNGCTVADPYLTTVGTHTLTATALDVAGNEKVETRTYTVLAWTLNGFYQPVDMGNVYNTVKNGSTVPFKFEIFAGTTELTDPTYMDYLKYGVVACDSSVPVDAIETVATGGTSLRYDLTGGQFIYNWKTPSLPGKCVSVTMKTDDGSSLSAFFKLK